MPASPTSTLAPTSFTTAHDNYLCERRIGRANFGDEFTLPCRPPREDWKPPPLKGTFPIAAWWPPNIDQLEPYADANFNVVFGDNLARSCQAAGTAPEPATAHDAFECIASVLPKINELGLKLSYFTGYYNHTFGLSTVQGAAYGGITEFPPTDKTATGYVSTPEVAWIVQTLTKRNLSHVLYSIFLRDDVVVSTQSVVESVRWLRTHAPHILPQVNGGQEDLYQDRQPIWSPEEYAVQGASSSNVTEELWRQIGMFSTNQYFAERYGLDVWPLFNLLRDERESDGKRKPFSDSLLRAQVHLALAYGARGLYYYCWGDNGLWNLTAPDAFSGHGEPMPNYFVAKALNADALVWGTTLLGARHVGALRAASVALPPCTYGGQSYPATACRGFTQMPRATSASMPVQDLEPHLLAGVFIAEPEDKGTRSPRESPRESPRDSRGSIVGYVMVVDVRVNATAGALGVATSNLTIHSACSPAVLNGARREAGGNDSDAQQHPLVATDIGAIANGSVVSVRLEAGGGQLIGLHGGAECVAVLHSVRERFFPARNPVALSFRPYWYDGFGAGGRYYLPGGLAGRASQYLIGGSYSGQPTGWRNPTEAVAWAQAGFAFGSIMVGDDEATLRRALGLAMAFGTLVLAAPSVNRSASPADVHTLIRRYGCHPNLMGLWLGAATASGVTNGTGAAVETMRREGFWMLPLVSAVASVADAVRLAVDGNMPVAPVSLPAPPLSSPTSTTATQQQRLRGEAPLLRDTPAVAWGQKTVDQLAALSHAASNASLAMSMAVSVDACATDAESLLRFGAYTSILLGSQMLWWAGVAECAPIGSEKFGLISKLNRRISTWAQPLMLPVGPALPPLYRVHAVWSTSSITFPPLGGVAGAGAGVTPRAPGSSPSDLIRFMDEELLAVELTNRSDVQRGMPTRVLLVLSTDLAATRGAPGVRQLELGLRGDVSHTVPIEPDALQGYADLPWGTPRGNVPNAPRDFTGADRCPMGWLGPRAPLRLPGGSVQVMSVQTVSDAPVARLDDDTAGRLAGRRAPRLVSGESV